MTRANCEGMVVNQESQVYGFCFSPDFDTSQQVSIGNFMRTIRNGNNIVNANCKVKKMTCKINGQEVPMLRFGMKALEDYKYMEYLQNRIKDLAIYSRNSANRLSYLQKHGITCSRVTLEDEEYLIERKNMFFLFVDNDDCLFFVANPYIFIAKEDELLQNKTYKKDCYLTVRRAAEKEKSYTDNLNKRQELFLSEMNELFDTLETSFTENGYVIGAATVFLNNTYVLLTGTKEDSRICIEENIFPYQCNDGIITRYSEEELVQIKTERDEYERKCSIVDERLDILEQVLKDQGRTWTIISRRKVEFDENDNYSVWMNAQDSDNAHFGWYGESDFIDWINMEGQIPFTNTKIEYWAKRLEEVSNNAFKFLKVENNLGVFERNNGGIIKFTEENIKFEIKQYTPIVRYTLNDLEMEIKKRKKKSPFEFLKKVFA